jgi:eukaryotic-like serine/threonine-protein kinase
MNERPPLDATVDVPPSGDDFDAGLAAAFGPASGPPLPAGGSVLKALSAGLPSVPRILLREPESFGGSPIVRPSSEEMPDKQDAGARLQLHGEIARGGMGAVLKGRDVDLGRDVAVKVLLETHQDKTEMMQRFVEEAQISGQLQHPGIAPVYELGQFVDKRPYFTMKLVKGKTLATLLAARKSPAEEQSRYVGIFAQICQTLAYAHARGVIHRDLKPSNVMVGAFGEVQVMDWGLAKVLKEGGIADELRSRERERAEVSIIRTQRSEGSSTPEFGSQTQAGTVLGTPAYMAPEQARGDVDLVDERADVFGLGAILCEILTGKPPYVGKGAELQYKARTAKLEDAFTRLDACGADAELIALTKHCLATELWERPRHAGEVAEQVTAYQQSVAERLRQAELAETEARARAQEESKTRVEAEARLAAERRARRSTLGLAAAVLVALTLAGGGGLWYQQQVAERRQEETLREAELREAVKAALEKVADSRQRGRWDEARTVLEQVQQRLGASGPEDLRLQVEQAEKGLALVDRLEAARLRASVVVDSRLDHTLAVWEYRLDHASAVREYTAAFREAGIGEEMEVAEVMAERIRSSPVREQLVATVDDWAVRVGDKESTRRAWLLAVARAADPDPWRGRFRDAKVWQDRPALEDLAKQAKVSELSPQILYALGTLLSKRGADAVPLLTAAQRRYPSDFWLNFTLGGVLLDAKRLDEAIGYYLAALALRPATSAVYNNLGVALRGKGRLDEAIAELKKAIELDTKLALTHHNLGQTLHVRGKFAEAGAAYREVIRLKPDWAKPHDDLAWLLATCADHKFRNYPQAIESAKRAVQLAPREWNFWNTLGMAYRNAGELAEAVASFQESIRLKPDWPHAHINLGFALREKGRLDEAIANCKKTLERDPKNAYAHDDLGWALHSKGRLDEAIAEYQKALALDPKYGLAHHNLGWALRNKGRLDEAIAEWKLALELDPTLPDTRRNLADFESIAAKLPVFLEGKYRPRDYAERVRLADLCYYKKYYRAGAQLYTDAFAAEPKRAETQNRLNAACLAALAGCGRGEDAEQLDDKERTRWRKQALDWLRADLSAYGKLMDGGKPEDRELVQRQLHYLQDDADLAGIRDAKELAKLPAGEQQACEKLWADVAALLAKSQSKK